MIYCQFSEALKIFYYFFTNINNVITVIFLKVWIILFCQEQGVGLLLPTLLTAFDSGVILSSLGALLSQFFIYFLGSL